MLLIARHNTLELSDNRGAQFNRETFIVNLNSNVHNYNTRRNIHIVCVDHNFAKKCPHPSDNK